MIFKLNLIDKQGNRLSASVKAETLAEAHQKAIARGFLIENEKAKEKDTDLIETMVISKEEVEKARKIAENENQASKAKAPRRKARGEQLNKDSNEDSRPSRINNRKRTGFKANNSNSNSKNLNIFFAISPILYLIAWFIIPRPLFLLILTFPILIFLFPILFIVGIVYSILILYRSIKNKDKRMIVFGSIATILNLSPLGIIIFLIFLKHN